MYVTTDSFDLIAWCQRLGPLMDKRHKRGDLKGALRPLTQAEAAELLGVSLRAYAAAEARNVARPGLPCNRTWRLLAERLEAEASPQEGT